jgi:hypothetical protein
MGRGRTTCFSYAYGKGSAEDEALALFHEAVGMEESGRIDMALDLYRMASKIDSDVERRA